MEKDCGIIQKLRKPKILNMSIFDWVCTFIAAIVISYFIYREMNLKIIFVVFLFLVLIGIIVHKLTNTPTMFNYYLGLNSKESVMKNRTC